MGKIGLTPPQQNRKTMGGQKPVILTLYFSIFFLFVSLLLFPILLWWGQSYLFPIFHYIENSQDVPVIRT
jgi:hypothetical protein